MKRIFTAGTVAGVALVLGLGAVPAAAFPLSAVSENPAPGGSGTGLSEARLNEAVLRDLGLTPAEFAAAGQLGRQAAGAVAALHDVPGYLGGRLQGGRVIVTGSGAELIAAAAKLSGSIPGLQIEPAAVETPAPGVGGSEMALTTEQLFQAYIRDVGPVGLQAVVTSGEGFVIRTGGTNAPESRPDTAPTFTAAPTSGGKMSPAEFVARYANVSLDDGVTIAPEVGLPGGLGYRTDHWVCSTGFSVFDPAGLPAVLTAGHCAADGAATLATLEFQGTPAGLLGQFAFSQFGGPGNSRILRPGNLDDPGNVGTDIAVIGDLRADLDPLPAASTWDDHQEPGPDVKIIGTAAPVIGMPVCRSGRSSGWSCGTIDEVGIFVVGGQNYGADPSDLRAFTGFLSFGVQSSGGDSGGPWVSGNYAVGTHSAGDTPDLNGKVVQNFAVAATLQDSLHVLPGYQLELFLNKPEVTAPAPGATFSAGQPIAGQIAAAPASAVATGSTVRIRLDGREPFEVPLDAQGAWSFTAPDTAGHLRFTAETVNGLSTSGAAGFDFAPVAPHSPPAAEPAAPEPAAPEPAAPEPADPPAPEPAFTPASEPTTPAPVRGAATQNPATADVPGAKGNVSPSGDVVVVGHPSDANLANTGVSGLFLAGGLAISALVVGGILLAFARRRNQRRTTR